MVDISTKSLDEACAAYARATGTYPSRAGLRAALHTIDLEEATRRDAELKQKRWAEDLKAMPRKPAHFTCIAETCQKPTNASTLYCDACRCEGGL